MEAIKFTFGGLELTNEVVNRLAAMGYTPESLKEAISKHEQTNGRNTVFIAQLAIFHYFFNSFFAHALIIKAVGHVVEILEHDFRVRLVGMDGIAEVDKVLVIVKGGEVNPHAAQFS